MGEHWRFVVWFAVLCAGFALMTVMAVFQTVAVHSIGMVA